jgi:hypothetical protein
MCIAAYGNQLADTQRFDVYPAKKRRPSYSEVRQPPSCSDGSSLAQQSQTPNPRMMPPVQRLPTSRHATPCGFLCTLASWATGQTLTDSCANEGLHDEQGHRPQLLASSIRRRECRTFVCRSAFASALLSRRVAAVAGELVLPLRAAFGNVQAHHLSSL